VRWLESFSAVEGTGVTGDDAPEIDGIAASATRAPLEAPPGIEAVTTWRYRSVEPRGMSVASPLIALLALWTAVMPRLGLGTVWGWALWTVPIALALAYRLMFLAGPLTAELQVRGTMLLYRARRFGLTVWVRSSDARRTGLDVTELPYTKLLCGGKSRGCASPGRDGPNAAAMAWLSAAIWASAAGVSTEE